MHRARNWLWWAGCLLAGIAVGLCWNPLSPRIPPQTNEPPEASSPEFVKTEPQASTNANRPVFTNVTAASGIDFVHTNGRTGRFLYLEIMGGGVALFDYDNDGDLDIYFVNGNRLTGEPDPAITNRLYRNEGAWRFTDVTQAAGVGGAGYGQGCTVADYNGDGWLDLYVTNFGPNLLYRNQGNETFANVTAAAGVGDPGWGQCACFFDYDGDGLLDLYAQNYLAQEAALAGSAFIKIGDREALDYPAPIAFPGSYSRLFRQEAPERFVDVTEAAGLHRLGKGMGLACADFTGDGRADLFVANDFMENFLFRAHESSRFEEIGEFVGVAYNSAGAPEASMGVDLADYDADGDLDLAVPCLSRQTFPLYRNDGDQFTDVAASAGIAQATSAFTGFDAHFLDFDGDADLDLFFSCGDVRARDDAPPNASYLERYGMTALLLANNGVGKFTDVSATSGEYFRQANIGRGSALGDIDNDGDLDLVVSHLDGKPALLRNDSTGHHWISLEFVDARQQKHPLGVDVWLTAGGRRQHAVTHPGVTYLSQSDRRLYFGLGDVAHIDRIDIVWPSGKKQTLTNVPTRQFLTVREADAP